MGVCAELVAEIGVPLRQSWRQRFQLARRRLYGTHRDRLPHRAHGAELSVLGRADVQTGADGRKPVASFAFSSAAQCARVAAKRAASISPSARDPNGASAAIALDCVSARRVRAFATPNSLMSVALPTLLSFLVALPTVASSPSASRRSSAI